MSNVQQGMSNVQETCSKTYFYYPVTPLACHPFINEGEVAMLPDAHFFPFINEGEVTMLPDATSSPSLMKGWHAKGVTG